MSETLGIIQTLLEIEKKSEEFRRGSKAIVHIATSLLTNREQYEVSVPKVIFVNNIIASHIEIHGTRWNGRREQQVQVEIPLSIFSLSFEETENAFIFSDGANCVTICK